MPSVALLLVAMVMNATHNTIACVVCARFHEYWLGAADSNKVAVHIVKYEDLLLTPFVLLKTSCLSRCFGRCA